MVPLKGTAGRCCRVRVFQKTAIIVGPKCVAVVARHAAHIDAYHNGADGGCIVAAANRADQPQGHEAPWVFGASLRIQADGADDDLTIIDFHGGFEKLI